MLSTTAIDSGSTCAPSHSTAAASAPTQHADQRQVARGLFELLRGMADPRGHRQAREELDGGEE